MTLCQSENYSFDFFSPCTVSSVTPPLSLSLSLCSKIQGEDEAEGAGWADCHTTSICTKRKLNKNQSNPLFENNEY